MPTDHVQSKVPQQRGSMKASTSCVWRMIAGLALVMVASTNARAADSDGLAFFREKIEPVLKAQCYGCHSGEADKVQAGLRLDSRAAVLRGGDSGPAVPIEKKSASPKSSQPIAASSSLLMQAIRHESGLAMPLKKPKLSDAVIADFSKWIELGVPHAYEGEAADGSVDAIEEGRKHWSFQPVRKPKLPRVTDENWGRSAIDAFVLKELEARKWQPAPPASRAELIRRVSFDLTGLPPTPEEIQAFVEDSRPDAYERLVDRLLGSRHYGERWAQHWLDVVRYAESEGYEYDRTIPDAWRYRDYVIRSFNADKPFDQFLIEQIAGDELDPGSSEFQTASIFHRLGPVRRNAGNPDIALSRNEVLTERTDIVGATFLGLTIGCARCHNHKLEPITQKDYYRLQAYFAATEEHNVILANSDEQREWEEKTKRVKDQMTSLRDKAKSAEGSEKVRLEEQIEKLEESLPPPLPTIPATRNDQTRRTPIHVLRRGVWEHKGELVGARPLSVLVDDELSELASDEAAPRTRLARWLAAPDHPLTARVAINRVWQWHFGTGLVKTANDFGMNGERPSHPELLDWLAATLVENGWRWKPIHRLILLSNTYRQSSRNSSNPKAAELDPANRLLWHFPRRRLSAEEVRDALLFVSGRINLEEGGPSVIVPVDPELVQLLYKPSQWSITRDAAQHDRRSIYLMAKRNLRLPFLENLDAPALQTSCARRESSTHAPQALELLNGRLSNDLAAAFAKRLEQDAAGDSQRLVDRAFQLALGRPPRPDERQRSLEFLREEPLTEFALALFNLNGFLYVP